MLTKLLRLKPLEPSIRRSGLQRTLTTTDLILMGIGAIIGAGVFVLTGIAAATKAGPAVVLAYMIAGTAAMFAALAYAELAASIGGSGSAYSYAYAGFGELIAWIIGWNLILEYMMAVSTVAIGWSGYINNFLVAVHIQLPNYLVNNIFEGGYINLLAFLVIALIAIVLSIGVKESTRVNNVIVVIKLLTVALFISVACLNINPSHWSNFMPFGWSGVIHGAALVFFAYIGFDALSTTAEECIHPQRSIPVGIIVSLTVCTLIYIIVSGLLTSIAPFDTLNVSSPVANALLNLGYQKMAGIIAVGAVAGLTTVILVMFYGLTRICLAIASDGLLPTALARINPNSHTPIRLILISGIIMGLIAGFVPIDKAAELVNIGTLAAFTFVCLGVIVFRITEPDLPRPFRLPLNPLIPLLGIFSCLYLMLHLPAVTWWRFFIWSGLGLAIYFSYSQSHSKIGSK